MRAAIPVAAVVKAFSYEPAPGTTTPLIPAAQDATTLTVGTGDSIGLEPYRPTWRETVILG